MEREEIELWAKEHEEAVALAKSYPKEQLDEALALVELASLIDSLSSDGK